MLTGSLVYFSFYRRLSRRYHTCSGGSDTDGAYSKNGEPKGSDMHLNEDVEEPSLDVLCSKLDLALDLYATLLAQRGREGGDKVRSRRLTGSR